jgi:uncharacterized OB-fold protein
VRFVRPVAPPASSAVPRLLLRRGHRSLDPEWQELVPFVTLVVELDEGPRVVAATELDRSEVVLGLRVALEVQRSSDDVAQLWARLEAPLQR